MATGADGIAKVFRPRGGLVGHAILRASTRFLRMPLLIAGNAKPATERSKPPGMRWRRTHPFQKRWEWANSQRAGFGPEKPHRRKYLLRRTVYPPLPRPTATVYPPQQAGATTERGTPPRAFHFPDSVAFSSSSVPRIAEFLRIAEFCRIAESCKTRRFGRI